MSQHPLMIDCDTGRDDALSIWVALALGCDLAAVVASYGNTVLDNVCENCLRVLHVAGRSDIPVWRGDNMPLADHPCIESIILPKQEMSGNGLCNLVLPGSPAAAMPRDAQARAEGIRALAAEKGPVDYIILGPATNFAATIQMLGSDVAKVIRRVTMWGGKLDPLWESMPGPDFNFGCDPMAVKVLLDAASQYGLPVRFMPMDVTWLIEMNLAQLQTLKASEDTIAQTARALMIAHAQNFAPDNLFRFHDPCVIMSLLHEDQFKPVKAAIETDTSHADFGRLRMSEDGAPVFLFDADAELRADMKAGILKLLNLS